jgi:hypothetical protein
MTANGHNHRDAAVTRLDHPQDRWPTLLSKLLDDSARVLEREVELFSARLEIASERAIIRGVNYLILAMIGSIGVLCLIAASVLLLHARLAWWEAFGATGIAVVLIVILGSRLCRG